MDPLMFHSTDVGRNNCREEAMLTFSDYYILVDILVDIIVGLVLLLKLLKNSINLLYVFKGS